MTPDSASGLKAGAEAMRWTPDRSLRRSGGGQIVLGGSPLKLFRLSANGARLLERALAGAMAEPTVQEGALLDRLADAGAIHPEPRLGSGPWKVDDVTVVVPVRDAQSRLDELIPKIRATTPGLRAVIVVDDGSSVPLNVEHPVELDGPGPGQG